MPDLELDHLLACLAHGLDESRPWPQPPPRLDWKRLLALLDQHRLSGLFHALGRSHSASWPEDVREQVRIERYRWLAHGEEARERVGRALLALGEAGVPVIVLKGWAHISALYHGDVSRRLCEDVDLLIHPRDADAAEAALRALGCSPNPPSWPGYARRYENGEIFFFATKPKLGSDAFSVGLHWGLFHVPSYDPARLDVADLFARARPLEVAGVAALGLAPVDEVAYLCGHLDLHHRFTPSLFRYFDIAALARASAEQLDWKEVADRAAQWQVLLSVRRVFAHLARLWPDLLPAEAMDAFLSPVPSRRERFVDAWLSATRGRPFFHQVLRWFTFPNWRQRPLIFLQDVFPGPAYLAGRYGRAPFGLWPLLYLRRLFRGLGSPFRGEKT